MTDRTPWRPMRSHLRSQNHDAVHQDDDAVHHITSHPLAPAGQAHVISDQRGLDDVLDRVRKLGLFAYDSEFIGETSYYPRLCLVQVATATDIYLIDPLAGLDIVPFWELVADPSIEKIVHAGQQDVEPVFRLLPAGVKPQNIFDTQIAAGFAALPYPLSLSKLAGSLIGAKMSKGFTVTDWERRPLSGSQKRYAADDVRYLLAIHAILRERLSQLGHLDVALAECQTLCEPTVYRFDADVQVRKIRGGSSLTARQLTTLRDLLIWRDSAGRTIDVPPRALVKDDILVDMARKPIRQVEDLDAVRGLPRPVEIEHGQDILDATRRSLARGESELIKPDRHEETPEERFANETAHALLQAICFDRGIDPAIVASRNDVAQWMRARRAGQDPQTIDLEQGWRASLIIEPLLKRLSETRNFRRA